MYRHRKIILWLNTELFLMRGFQCIPSSIGLECLMFPVNLYTRAIRTNLIHATAIGQVEIEHTYGRILWIFDQSNQEKTLFGDILDSLAIEAGLRGLHFLAGTAINSGYVYEALSNAGYSPLTWQKIWQHRTNFLTDGVQEFEWRKTKSSDLLSIDLLQNRLLSPNEKIITPPATKKPPAFILFYKGTVCGYAYVVTSPNKIMITPIIEPKLPFIKSVINVLVSKFFNHISVHYLVEISSQRWIETTLTNQITVIQPRYEIMVKHLAVHKTLPSSNFVHSRNNRQTDVITPIIKINNGEDNI